MIVDANATNKLPGWPSMFLELLSTPARIPWIDSQSDSDVHNWLSGFAGTFIKPLQDGDSQELLRRWRCPGMGLHEGSMAIVVLMVCPWLRVTQDGQTPGLDNQPQASYKSPAQARMKSDGDLWMSWWQTWDFLSDLCTGCKTRQPCGFQANHGKTWQTI